MAESEKQLELKKRARRRLVGAAALALTAAILLPMVMDHEPKPPTQDIQIRIPSPDNTPLRGAQQKPADAPPKPDAKPEPKPETRAEPKADAAPAATPPEPAKSVPEAEKGVAEPAGKPVTAAVAKPDPATPAKPAPAAEAKKEAAEPKPSARPEREARVEAILSGKETVSAPVAGAGDFVVQLGAFSDPANVSKVRARVKEAGFASYTETLKGPKGDQTRVRAGPFASRDAAEQAAAKLKHAGLAGVVASR